MGRLMLAILITSAGPIEVKEGDPVGLATIMDLDDTRVGQPHPDLRFAQKPRNHGIPLAAGEQTEEGTTARDPEERRPEPPDPDAAAHVGRPGEGEGRERLEFEGERPRSERLGDRDG